MSGPAGFAAQGGCLGRWGTRTGSWGGRGRRGIVVVCFPCRGWRGLREAAANGVGWLGNEGIGVIHDLPTGYVFFSRSPPLSMLGADRIYRAVLSAPVSVP